jgi:alpha-tubulin suppressor-like RCC1 family protein
VIVDFGGGVWTAGSNQWGQLGNGQTGNGVNALPTPTPVQVPGLITHVTSTYGNVRPVPATAGARHNLAIAAGRVWAWGHNDEGQLGDGTMNSSPTPVSSLIPVATPPVAVAGGYDQSLALLDDGSVWSWGGNAYGQLGRSGPTATPGQVPLPLRAIAIYAGGSHSAAILVDQTLWGWGFNGWYAVGNGNNLPAPAPVSMLTGVRTAALGLNHGIAVSHGQIRTWGVNNYGCCGVGNNLSQTSPVAIANPLTGAFEVGAGTNYSFAYPAR